VFKATPRMVQFQYEISNGESGQVLASGETKHVFLGKDLRPVKLAGKYLPLFGITSVVPAQT
jgi:acyl-CoA thioesterase FadM